MKAEIPESYRDLLNPPYSVILVTLMPDGQPQASVVWAKTEDGDVIVNSARGRQKVRNMEERPRVTVLGIDPQDDHRWIEVRGEVVEVSEEGAAELIDELSQLYRGRPYFKDDAERASMQRVTFRIRPKRVVVYPSN